jgi:DNA-binding transcriptional LysR family regulator
VRIPNAGARFLQQARDGLLQLDNAVRTAGAAGRGAVGRLNIGILSSMASGFLRELIDLPSAGWLGQYADRPKVRASGLWNNNHVDVDFLTRFEALIAKCRPQPRRCISGRLLAQSSWRASCCFDRDAVDKTAATFDLRPRDFDAGSGLDPTDDRPDGVRRQPSGLGNFCDGGALGAGQHFEDCRDRGLLGVAWVGLGFVLWHPCLPRLKEAALTLLTRAQSNGRSKESERDLCGLGLPTPARLIVGRGSCDSLRVSAVRYWPMAPYRLIGSPIAGVLSIMTAPPVEVKA